MHRAALQNPASFGAVSCRIARPRAVPTAFPERFPRRPGASRALPDSDGEKPPSSAANTVAFLGTVAGGAFAGAAVVKYGSLLTDAAFTPSPALALAIVFSPPIGFAAWMLSQGKDVP